MSAAKKFYANQLVSIMEGKVKAVAFDDSTFEKDGQLWIGLVIEKANKEYILWLSRDDDRNGPGSFFLEEQKD